MSDTLLTVTKNAAEQVLSLGESNLLRVRVIGGGCSGLQYVLDFDHEHEDDLVIDSEGIKILLDPKTAQLVQGSTLDYSGGLNGKGFEIKNPNAERSCGCGSSFSV